MVYKSKQTNQNRRINICINTFGDLQVYCIFECYFILKFTPNIFYYGKKNNRCDTRRWHR
jgi:hypothetical protein